MSNVAKLKKKAVELEQKKLLDKALPLYIQFLQESDGAIDDIDIPIYNRVGDLLLRTRNASDALNYYEKAVDLYAERGFLNNAIALCNKVLRQSPGRASIYYKLGKISATKGFKSDAKKNFLEYADRMQKGGQIDEAFRALKEFADLCPDQDDIRLMLAEQLSKENRQDEAMEQLQKLHDKLDSEGRSIEARATADRMKSIDPDAVPRVSGSHRPQKSADLIFLDTSFEQEARSRKPERPSAPPAGRQVSDPDLVVLTLADQPDASVSPLHNAMVADAFDLDVIVPNDTDAASPPLSMLDVDAGLDLVQDVAGTDDVVASVAEPVDVAEEPAFVAPMDLDVADDEAFVLPPAPELDATPLGMATDVEPPTIELAAEPSAYVSGPPLGIDYAGDLAADVILPGESSDLFDFRAPPRSDDSGRNPTPVSSLDPDVAFPSFDLDDALPSADDVTSGASLAAALGIGDSLGGDFEPLDDDPTSQLLAEEIDAEQPAPSGAATGPSIELDWQLSEAPSRPAVSADLDGLEVAADAPPVVERPHHEPDTADDYAPVAPVTAEPAGGTLDATIDIPIEALLDTSAEPNASDVAVDVLSLAPPDHDTVAVDLVATSPDAEGVAEAEPDPRAGWEIQREHAEQLLEAGDRATGVAELEQVAAELERIGDLERSLSIVDELIRLLPDSVRHHQKRVELSFRSSDRVKLIDAYLELGDALFRSGEERKARAVYQRVLELAPDDPRARMAVESVASMSPPMGSGAIPAIPPATTPTPESRPSIPPRARDMHVPYQSVTGNGGRSTAGVSGHATFRRPSPLDPSAAPNGEFVDLGDLLRSGQNPRSTRMVAEEKPPTGDEQADFQEMLKRFKQGVAENVDDEDYESHYDLGVAYKEMGLMDEAVAEFQKALRGSANRVRACEALGQCFVEKQQYQVAASVLSRAIALGEGDDHHLVGVLYLLGQAMEALNKPGDALDYYQRVFAVDIEFRDVADRISSIEGKAT